MDCKKASAPKRKENALLFNPDCFWDSNTVVWVVRPRISVVPVFNAFIDAMLFFYLLKSDYEEATEMVVNNLRQANNALLEKYPTDNKYKQLIRYGYDLEYIKIGDDIAVFFPQISNFFVCAGFLYYPKEATFINKEEKTIILDEVHTLIYDSLTPINEQWYYIRYIRLLTENSPSEKWPSSCK